MLLFLKKKGFKSGKWQERTFDLHPHYLVYQRLLVAKGQINILGATVERVGQDERIDPLSTTLSSLQGTPLGHNYALKLKAKYSPNSYRVYYLAAPNEADLNEWLDALNTNIAILETGPRASICTTLRGAINNYLTQPSTAPAAGSPDTKRAAGSPDTKRAATGTSSGSKILVAPAPSHEPAKPAEPRDVRDFQSSEAEQASLRELIGRLMPGTAGFAGGGSPNSHYR